MKHPLRRTSRQSTVDSRQLVDLPDPEALEPSTVDGPLSTHPQVVDAPPSPRIKVFFFIPTLDQGGAERQILALMSRLPARFEPVLALWHDQSIHFPELLPPGQPRHVLGTNRMTPASFRRLVDILRAEQPTIVHCFLNRANFWGRLAALRAGVPVVISSNRARMMELRYLPFERWLSQRCQLIITNSVGVRDELVGLARVAPERIRIIHNVLDLEHFRPPTPAERQAARAHHGFSAGQRVLVLPGRVSVQKHQLGLLLALARLARQGRLPDDLVVSLPGRQSGTLVGRLVAALAGRRCLRSAVRLPGAESDMRCLYWSADMLVLPSLWEGLPNVALEAAACGLPAVLSHSANLDGIVAPGESGWEVPTGNHWALAEALAEALALPPERWAELGQRGRQRIEALFQPARVVAETVAAYDQLLAERPKCVA
jgi:glycosyltransferase involved in cell wall biosynthesis